MQIQARNRISGDSMRIAITSKVTLEFKNVGNRTLAQFPAEHENVVKEWLDARQAAAAKVGNSAPYFLVEDAPTPLIPASRPWWEGHSHGENVKSVVAFTLTLSALQLAELKDAIAGNQPSSDAPALSPAASATSETSAAPTSLFASWTPEQIANAKDLLEKSSATKPEAQRKLLASKGLPTVSDDELAALLAKSSG